MAKISKQALIAYAVLISLLINSFIFIVGDSLGTSRAVDEVLNRFGTLKNLGWKSDASEDAYSPDIPEDLEEEEEDFASNLPNLKHLCAKTKWRDGLWLHCHSGCGPNKKSFCMGLTNARSRMQACIRLAIDAGAGVILPSVSPRDQDDLANLHTDKSLCPETWWDIDYLQETVQRACPPLKIQTCPANDTPELERIVQGPARDWRRGGGYQPGTFRKLVDDALGKARFPPEAISPVRPVVFQFSDTFVGWNYSAAEEMGTVRKDLFLAMPFNRTLLDLSRRILRSPELHGGDFFGVHLRVEKDWHESGNVQMRQYVEQIERIHKSRASTGTRAVFVSCGDREAIQRFRAMLGPRGYEVHDKWTLLANRTEDLALVEGQRFDQKAIVEYQTLVGARFFLGVWKSTMSDLIAYARTRDKPDDFFERYIYPNSTKDGRWRNFGAIAVMGNLYTNLMVEGGYDLMDSFP